MFPKMNTSNAKREAIINILACLRQEWEAAAEGQSLIDIQASIGLTLADIVFSLGFTRDEEDRILGERLRYEALFTQDERVEIIPEEEPLPTVEEPTPKPAMELPELEAVIPGNNGNH
jgi:hypothetical protein